MNVTKVGSLYGSVNYYGETSLIREIGLTEPRSFFTKREVSAVSSLFCSF